MNYWHMQIHPDSIDWGKEKEVLENFHLIGMGDWKKEEEEEVEKQQEYFEKTMNVGDIVAIKRGSMIVALTKVIGEYQYTDNVGKLDWFPRRRKVEILDWYKESYNYSIAPRGTLTRCDINRDAPSTVSITNWYKMVLTNSNTNNIFNLLKHKNQIILQGPPGTGKTRQAKKIAEELTKSRAVGNPEMMIDDLINNFNPNDEMVKKTRENRDNILAKFHTLFPKENLNNLSLIDYCIGNSDKNNFCWWMERGLQALGYYFPGSSISYLIYWSKDSNDYKKHGFVKDLDDSNEAMKKIAELIYNVVINKNPEIASQYFGESFLLKILNSYYPDEYFPINSKRMIDNALKLLNVNTTSLNTFEKNKKLNKIFLDKKDKFNSNISNFEFGKLLLDSFNLKTGEILTENKVFVVSGESEIIQFHPAYSYEDFVRGIVAETTESGQISYKVKNKILAEFTQKAIDNPKGNYVLIIDEINRANLPSVLGELIYALEYRNEPVTSLYEYEGEREIILPKNLYIIGTMNTADRSVGHIDYAIRRRFAFIDVLPDESVIELENAKNLFRKIQELFSSEHLSPEFKAKDVMIGHSYFIVKNDEELKLKLEYEIKPILREYLKDGIFLDNTSGKIESLYV